MQPCSSCEGVIAQFKEKFPQIDVVVFWDLPFPA
ncbi:MAG: deaminase domain-containing protein [Cyanobacteria bacterium P01_G01_bin.54]